MDSVLYFWENAKDFIGLIGIGAFFAIAYIIINRSRTIFSKMFANNILENRLEHKTVSKLLKNYIPHRLKDVNSGMELSYKEFKHAIRHNKYVVIVGSAGIGKSALMTKLAFSYRRMFDKKTSVLEDLSIIYYKIKREMIIDKISKGISEKLKNHKNSTVFIDGFDELNCLSSDNSYELLEQLLAKLEQEAVNGNCNKLIISMRKEIFENGIESISKQQFGMSDPAIFEILPFSVKQSKYYFKHFFCGTQKRRKYKILKSVLENNPNSIFQYPFVLQFVDVILDEECSQIETMDLYTALNIIVCKGLQRECDIYNRFISNHDHKINAEKYIEYGISFLQYAARVMLENENMGDHITAKEIAQYEKNTQYEHIKLSDLLQDKNLSTTRRLLKYNEAQHSYEFIHGMLYEYFIAQAILSGNYIRAEKKKYIDCLSASRTLLPEFCYKAAIELCRSAINIDKTPNINENDIRKIKSLEYVSKNENITVETVLRAFPYVESFCIDEKIVIDEEIDYILYGKTLDLSERNSIDLSYLNCFEKESLIYIDLADNILDNIEVLNSCTALKDVVVSIDRTDTVEKLNKLSPSINIYVYTISDNVVEIAIKLYESINNTDGQHPKFYLLHFPIIDNCVFMQLSKNSKYALITLESLTCTNTPLYALKWGHSEICNDTYFRFYSFLDDCFLNDRNEFCLLSEQPNSILQQEFDTITKLFENTLLLAGNKRADVTSSSPLLPSFYYGYMLFLKGEYEKALPKLLEFVDTMADIKSSHLTTGEKGIKSITIKAVNSNSELKKIIIHESDAHYYIHNIESLFHMYSIVLGVHREHFNLLFMNVRWAYCAISYYCIATCYYMLRDYSNENKYYNKRFFEISRNNVPLIIPCRKIISSCTSISNNLRLFFDDNHTESLRHLNDK